MAKNFIKSFSYKEDKEPVMDELAVIAARERKDTSKIIVELIEDYVKGHSEGNSTFKLDKWNEDPDFQAVPALMSDQIKWRKHYKNSDTKARTDIRVKLIQIMNQIDSVELSDGTDIRMRVKR